MWPLVKIVLSDARHIVIVVLVVITLCTGTIAVYEKYQSINKSNKITKLEDTVVLNDKIIRSQADKIEIYENNRRQIQDHMTRIEQLNQENKKMLERISTLRGETKNEKISQEFIDAVNAVVDDFNSRVRVESNSVPRTGTDLLPDATGADNHKAGK
ncbi:MAG: hypothetical protein ACE14T_09225 [Syntrophales bacterium]